jgi:hypothetical protein
LLPLIKSLIARGRGPDHSNRKRRRVDLNISCRSEGGVLILDWMAKRLGEAARVDRIAPPAEASPQLSFVHQQLNVKRVAEQRLLKCAQLMKRSNGIDDKCRAVTTLPQRRISEPLAPRARLDLRAELMKVLPTAERRRREGSELFASRDELVTTCLQDRGNGSLARAEDARQ